jgi:hypothetical protein
MKPISPSNGNILVLAIVIIFMMSVSLGYAAHILALQKQEVWLYFTHIKARWLALSGLSLANQNLNILPIFPEPFTKEKCLENKALFFHINQGGDAEIFLAKTTDAVYSIGTFKQHYRVIYKRYMETNSSTLVWKSIERL